MSVQVPGLREPALAPLAGVRLLAGVHHGVAAQVVRVLEALAALGACVGLLPRVSPLVALEGVHARESLPTQRARGHVDIGGGLAADAVLLAEVCAQVDLQDVGAGEDLVAQGAHEDLARGAQDIGDVGEQTALHAPLHLDALALWGHHLIIAGFVLPVQLPQDRVLPQRSQMGRLILYPVISAHTFFHSAMFHVIVISANITLITGSLFLHLHLHQVASQHVLWDKDSVELQGLATVFPAAVACGSASPPAWGMPAESEGNRIHMFPGSAAKSLLLGRMFNFSSSPSSSSLGKSPAMWLLPSERLSTLSEQLEASSSFLVLSASVVAFSFSFFLQTLTMSYMWR